MKGFALDDEKLRDGKTLGGDYFDELLERIRDIRASEKRFYGKIRDLFTLAVDYDATSRETQEFFQVAQNKLHWAITKHTAAEIVAERADASKPNMGLTTWKGAKVRKGDVTVAKNYLNEDEVRSLNRIVTMYLDYAEEQAERRKTITHARLAREARRVPPVQRAGRADRRGARVSEGCRAARDGRVREVQRATPHRGSRRARPVRAGREADWA